MDSTDSVVMGGQKKRDTLADMPRFGGCSVQESEVRGEGGEECSEDDSGEGSSVNDSKD